MPKIRSLEEEKEYQAIGQRIKMSRLNAGLSQTELGEKVGVTFQQIQKYEKGSNKCPVVTLREIGYITKANMPWLFGFEECI